jgi:hypothetical protein
LRVIRGFRHCIAVIYPRNCTMKVCGMLARSYEGHGAEEGRNTLVDIEKVQKIAKRVRNVELLVEFENR